MIAIFLCEWINGQPDIPPMDAEEGLQLHFDDNKKGGYSMVGDAPPQEGKKTCLVWVWADAPVITAMMADTERYPWYAEVK